MITGIISREMDNVIVIGDVHGCYKTLRALLAKLDHDIPVCFTGDLIDRGPASRDVVRFVLDSSYYCVVGNHERMAYESLIDGQMGLWISNGGYKTIKSYDSDMDELWRDVAALNNLDIVHAFRFAGHPKLIVSHSSAYATLESNAGEDELIWGRDLNPPEIPGSFNVFGHTIQKSRKPLVGHHFACVDTGAFLCLPGDPGVMTALEYPGLRIVQQENIDN